MIKIYLPSTKEAIGGGWTFKRNLKKGLEGKAEFVNSVDECDVMLISGVTMVDKADIYRARELGKKVVFRVDNVPQKSRNRRSTPHERIKEFADLSDLVIYQSNWAKEYVYPLAGEGMVIYNGVDQSIFYPPQDKPNVERYLFAFHGKHDNKAFWESHYLFQMASRKNPKAEFLFIYDFGNDLSELQNAGFDFWNGEIFAHLPKMEDPEEMADIMRQCSVLLFPAIVEAAPNTVLEARACGLRIEGVSTLGGTPEYADPDLDISLERMANEYLAAFELVCSEKEVGSALSTE